MNSSNAATIVIIYSINVLFNLMILFIVIINKTTRVFDTVKHIIDIVSGYAPADNV